MEIKSKQVSFLYPTLNTQKSFLMFKELDRYETERLQKVFSLQPPEKLFFKCQETEGLYKRHFLFLKNENAGM